MSILFQNVTAVLMDDAHTVLPHAFVAVEGRKITHVGTDKPQGAFERVIDGKGGILMPGLVNCHTHIPMTAMRGYGDGHNLQDWLNDFIFPVEGKWDDRATRACTMLGLMEMISSGTTCIADMYMRTPIIAQAIAEAGISANLSTGGVFFGETFSPDACGMSTAPEAIAAAHAGMEILVFSMLTNMCAGILDKPILGDDVNETAEARKGPFSELVLKTLEKL